MKRYLLILMVILVAGGSRSTAATRAEGRHAVAVARHDWKTQVRATHAQTNVQTLSASAAGQTRGLDSVGPVPPGFRSMSPEARLAYLLARRDISPSRFDRFHPALGSYLATDERLRAAQALNCAPLDGLFPNAKLAAYLHYRRGLNPVRFDYYHPGLGALLAEDDRLKAGLNCANMTINPPQVSPETITPPGTSSGSPPSGGTGISPGGGGGGTPGSGGGGGGTGPIMVSAVPEPTSLTLILLGSAVAGLPATLRRRRAARRV